MKDLIKFKKKSLNKERFINIHWDIRKLIENEGIWLAGGAIRSCIKKEIPSDYDIFFRSQEEAITCKTYLENLKYTKVFQCPIGSLTTYIGTKDNIKVQLITPRYYDTIEILLNSFDFTITLGAIDNNSLYLSKRFIKSHRSKILELHKLTYPTATINRAYKYKSKGYNIVNCLLDIVERIYNKDQNIIDIGVYYID